MSDRVFAPDVVAAVTAHVNADHRDACLDIVRALGDAHDATEAWLTDVDAAGATFGMRLGGEVVPVRVPWSRRIAERGEIRTEIVALHDRATASAR